MLPLPREDAPAEAHSTTGPSAAAKTRRKSLLSSLLSSGKRCKMRNPVDLEQSDSDDKEDSYELDVSKFIEQERLMHHMNRLKKSCSPTAPKTATSSSSDLYLDELSVTTSRSPILEQFFDSFSEQDKKEVGLEKSLAGMENSAHLRDNWRHLSTRSILSMDSLKSSDSDLELLDCQSLAMATTCSDDTCSSVELVWTRSKNVVGKQGARLDKNSKRRSMSFLNLRRPKSVGGVASPFAAVPPGHDWVANPLFSNDTSESDSSELRRCSSCDSIPQHGGHDEAHKDLDECSEQTGKNLKKRWSVLEVAKSPFNMCQDNSYLNQLKNNLAPSRIKSNVSQLKSQLGSRLSETGKRASILADQLLTSIKDTTRELSGVVVEPEVEKCDPENSFACAPQPVASMDSKNQQQFSLIFLHRQHQNGLQVVTRQPQPIGGHLASNAGPQLTSQPPPPSLNTSTNPLESPKDKSVHTSPDTDTVPQREEPQKSDLAFHSDTVVQSADLTPTYCVSDSGTNSNVRRTRRRRQANRAQPSDDEDEDNFMEREYLKVMSDVTVSRRVRRRNLRYWRRNKANFRPIVSI